jgi:serine protease Do
VKLGRIEVEKKAALTPKKDSDSDDKPVVKKALGLDLANLTDALRKKHNIKDKVKGVLITAVEPNSAASEKRLVPGMVIAEVQQQSVANATELQQRIDKLKKDGKKAVVLLVVTPDGDPSFVALSLQ